MRSAALALYACLAACGSSEPAVAHPEPVARTVEAIAPVDAAVAPVVVIAEPELEPVAPPDPGPVDHSALSCFSEPVSHVVARFDPGTPVTLRAETRSSHAADRAGLMRVRPGAIVRFQVTLTNVGTDAIVLDAAHVDALAQLSVTGQGAGWTQPIRTAGPLVAGQRLLPGAVVRLCAELDVGRSPIDAAEARELERAYTIDWPMLQLGREQLAIGQQTVDVHYAPEHAGPSVREPESWGGVLRVVLREGASAVAIARETGLRLGTAAPLFDPREEPVQGGDPHAILMQAPPDRRVADVAAILVARPDIASATPMRHGDPGTEGCSANSPCARGEQCCYMCGIPGCPLSCFPGRSCPTGIP